jgi:beta-galactosidase
MDFDWMFAYGHYNDFEKDYYNSTGYFTYFAKAGYGDGPASKNFDDRTWRKLDLPHDWAVEQEFSGNASHSHGYKTVGWKYPERSVGWYRKSFNIPESDLGRRISIQFDGIYRNAIVWVNGFYLGREQSGYAETEYDISDYLNYGGKNVVVVRADASIEEGWFYEGAGIYRHVWLNKTEPLHVAKNGTFVSSVIDKNNATINIATTIINKNTSNSTFEIDQNIIDPSGNLIGSAKIDPLSLKPNASGEFTCKITINNPKLWSLEIPYLHKLITTVRSGNSIKDIYETTFGIRSLHFDANEGFFLNGKNIKLKGTNNHQDHAGVGAAIPDALQEYRIAKLKEMGSNAYRCSHNPPTPELLDACDRLGMLVLVENRLMGSNQEHLDLLKRMMLRDRNHPSVILWSLGNEEWAIEGNITGARITSSMQAYAQSIDSTRRITTAISGGWGAGISTVIDVMGYNYLTHGNIDDHHKKFPNQPALGTEESTTSGTRGIYEDDKANGHMAATDRTGEGPSIETGWKYYDERSFLAGLFYWTGFDYKGEPNPLGWPAVSSQFGIIDACGFPKDVFYYLKSVWTSEPVLHIFPHWNWKGKEDQEIKVWAYTNCDEVELFLNKKSLGRKPLPKNSHIEWIVKYQPGVLLAKGYKGGKEILKKQIETTGEAVTIQFNPTKTTLNANGEDISVVNIQLNDANGRFVPTARNEITFTISGPGKIIGAGNGDPGSHEPDRFIETVKPIKIDNWKASKVDSTEIIRQVSPDFDDSKWRYAFKQQGHDERNPLTTTIYRGVFEMPEMIEKDSVTLFLFALGENNDIYINGKLIAKEPLNSDKNFTIKLNKSLLRTGKNSIAVIATPFKERRRFEWDYKPGSIQIYSPAESWKRKAFNGLLQVIVQATRDAGEITLTAQSSGLKTSILKIQTLNSGRRPSI